MKKILLTLSVGLLLATASFAAAIPELITSIQSVDYKLRQSARLEMQSVLAEASKPGADQAGRLEMEKALCTALASEQTVEDAKMWILRMLTVFGSDYAIPTLEAQLADPSKERRDAARQALTGNLSKPAIQALRKGFSQANGLEKIGFIDSLVYLKDTNAVKPIAQLLSGSNETLAIKAADALGSLNNPGAMEALMAAHKAASGTLKESIEVALVNLGASNTFLINEGANDAVRVGAFRQLIQSNATEAQTVLSQILSQTNAPAREDIMGVALLSGNVDVQKSLIGHLDSASENDQLIILSGIADLKLSAYEDKVIALINSSSWKVSKQAIFTLGQIGGTESYDALYTQYQAKAEDHTGTAISMINLPEIDTQLFETVTSSTNDLQRFAALKLLGIRNPNGTLDILNRLAAPSESEQIRQAVFSVLETVGDAESAKLLAIEISGQGALQRPAQKSLKKLCQNIGTPDVLFSKVFKPAMASTPNDEGRIALLAILDGVSGTAAEAYLAELLKNTSSPLNEAALNSLKRWAGFGASQLWLDMAKDPESFGTDAETVEKGLVRILSRPEIKASGNEKVKVAQQALAIAPTLEFKKAMVASLEVKKLNNKDKRPVAKFLNTLLNDPELGASARAALGMPPLEPAAVPVVS